MEAYIEAGGLLYRLPNQINRDWFARVFPRFSLVTYNSSFDWLTVLSVSFVIG